MGNSKQTSSSDEWTSSYHDCRDAHVKDFFVCETSYVCET